MLFVANPSPGFNHEHLIYISDSGAVECSQEEGHRHPIRLLPPSASDQPTTVIIEPADNHVHEAAPLEPAEYADTATLMDTDTDEEVVAKKIEQFELAHECDRESILRGQESVRFREGDQWTDEAKTKLISKSRACLTINQVAPMIEALSGIFRRNRTDLKCYPTENGDSIIAEVLTYALKNVATISRSDAEETEAFEDASVVGRGLLEVFPDFDADLQGILKVRHRIWDTAVFGPHTRKDLEDCEFFFTWDWLSRRKALNEYPEFEDEINTMYSRFEQAALGIEDMTDLGKAFTCSLLADTSARELRKLICEEKEFYRLKVYLDTQTGFAVEETQVSPPLRKHLKKMKAFRMVERKLHRLRRTTIMGDILLDDKYVDKPTPPGATGPSFGVFPVYAYKRGNRFEGKVERVKDPQREINKRRSQIVDIVNTSINNGWLVPHNGFGSQKARQNFKNSVSTPGFCVDVPDMQNLPVKIEGGRVEPSIVQLEMNSLQSFREVSNVNAEMLGIGSQYQSGRAMAHRLAQSLQGNEYLFDNMSMTKKRIGLELLLWIQAIYTPERIMRIFMDQAKIEQAFVNNKEVDPEDQQTMIEIATKLQDADLSKYDVTIGETGQSPTAQLASFELMMELAQKGVQLPPQVFLELAPIPNKARLMQIMQQASEQQTQAEDKKYDTEIQKTTIAAQSKQQPRQG